MDPWGWDKPDDSHKSANNKKNIFLSERVQTSLGKVHNIIIQTKIIGYLIRSDVVGTCKQTFI